MKIPLDDQTRERLLIASPEELRALAQERPELDRVVRALLGANQEIGEALQNDQLPHSGTTRRQRRWMPWSAAAAVAALALWAGLSQGRSGPQPPSGEEGPGPHLSSGAPGVGRTSGGLDVEAPGDFAVFPTQDPDMSVVWIFNGDE